MMAVGMIVAGYVAMVWQFGWPGVVAVALHVGVMLLGVPRR